MKVFISYGSVGDQVTAFRLQALGAVNGLQVYVPPAHSRRGSADSIDVQSEPRLRETDFVLGLVGAGLSPVCWRELNLGRQLNKSVFIMAESSLAEELSKDFPGRVGVIDPSNPTDAELQIINYLTTIEAQGDSKKAILALAIIGIGLLMLAPQD